jgi:hypothetical protein
MRALVNFLHFLRQLEPRFDDCPEPCARSEDDQDLPDFCNECEVRAQWNFFRQEFDEQIARRFAGEKIGWSFDSLYADVNRIRRVDASVRGKGYPRGCDVLTARCLDLWRSEEWRPSRIKLWELDQKKGSGNE